jgi:putative inorganic carbon (hco3(-)) transporter
MPSAVNILSNRSGLAHWLRHQFITKKMMSPLGFILMALMGIGVAYLSAFISYKMAFVMVAAFVGLVLAVACLLYPYFGFYFSIILSTLIFTPERLLGIFFPFGIVVEIFTYFTLLGVLTQQYAKEEIHREFWRHPITIMLILLLGFYTLQAVNPSPHSMLGWFNYYRKFLSFLAFYFIAYCLLNSRERIRFFLMFWIYFAVILAAYAVKQQWLGFSNWELTWIMADEKRLELLWQHGLLRKFSILPDPAASGVLFSAMMIFSLIIAIRTSNKKLKWWLYVFSIINFLAFSYSGTRTGNLMILAGIFFYSIATIYDKRTIRFLAVTVGIVGLILVIPYQNPVLYRIQSTFQGSKDPSAAFRDMNRKNIQPYILKHPIGGGISTCGVEGQMYSPGHILASVPPDSGYMKIAMEQGWIGLALTLIFYYLILRTGIKHFYRCRAPEIRMWYIAIMTMLFTLMVGQFSQIVIGQYPTIFFFYPAIVILIKLSKYEQTNKSNNTEVDQNA